MSAPFVSCECFLWEYLALSLVSNSWGYPRHFLVVGQRTSPGASLLKSSPALPSTGWVNLVQFYSVSQLCLTLCDPMDCSTPGFPSPTPGACSNSCLLSQWCHPTILSSAIPFFCLQSFPASGSFPMSPPFAKVLELQLQHQSFQWMFRVNLL